MLHTRAYQGARSRMQSFMQASKTTASSYSHCSGAKTSIMTPTGYALAVPRCYFNLDKQEVESIVSALNFEAAYKIVQDSYYAKYFERKATPEETIANAEKAFRKAILAYAKKSVSARNLQHRQHT